MHLSTFPAALLLSLLASPALAQWGTIPMDPVNSVQIQQFLVTHQNSQGIQVFSAYSQNWSTMSPPGSTYRGIGDYYVVTQETGNVLRGWSARLNASATQPVSNNISMFNGTGDLCLVFDLPPFTNGFLRVYNAETNTWNSFALTAPPSGARSVSRTAVVAFDGTQYVGFSSRTGQWATLPVTTEGRSPWVYDDMISIDLAGLSALGPSRVAAFSGIRGNWDVSPVYVGPVGLISLAQECAAVRVALPNPAQVSYCGFSAYTGRWTTSPLVHNLASSITAVGYHNLVRVLDTDTTARYEIFGAGSGVWSPLTGPNLVEAYVHDDFAFVSNTATGAMLACSALKNGGWTSVTDPTGPISNFASTSQHAGMVLAAAGSGYMYGYSPMTNAFVGPVPCPVSGQSWTVAGGAVVGFNVYGYAGQGTHAQALSARWGTWSPGPLMTGSGSTRVFGSGSVLLEYDSYAPGGSYDLNVFDEHSNHWLPPYSIPNTYSFQVGANSIAAWGSGGGSVHLYSAHTSEWTVIPGFATGIGSPTVKEGLLCFTANNLVYAWSNLDTTHSWYEWPMGPDYATSGPSLPGGGTPAVKVSSRGLPGVEMGFLYGAFALGPSPVTIPGVGNLDLDPAGTVYVANLGVFDADGLAEFQVPLPGSFPGLQIWFQTLKVNINTLQASLPGRASAGWIF